MEATIILATFIIVIFAALVTGFFTALALYNKRTWWLVGLCVLLLVSEIILLFTLI